MSNKVSNFPLYQGKNEVYYNLGKKSLYFPSIINKDDLILVDYDKGINIQKEVENKLKKLRNNKVFTKTLLGEKNNKINIVDNGADYEEKIDDLISAKRIIYSRMKRELSTSRLEYDGKKHDKKVLQDTNVNSVVQTHIKRTSIEIQNLKYKTIDNNKDSQLRNIIHTKEITLPFYKYNERVENYSNHLKSKGQGTNSPRFYQFSPNNKINVKDLKFDYYIKNNKIPSSPKTLNIKNLFLRTFFNSDSYKNITKRKVKK